jgi:hypothetical protein
MHKLEKRFPNSYANMKHGTPNSYANMKHGTDNVLHGSNAEVDRCEAITVRTKINYSLHI